MSPLASVGRPGLIDSAADPQSTAKIPSAPLVVKAPPSSKLMSVTCATSLRIVSSDIAKSAPHMMPCHRQREASPCRRQRASRTAASGRRDLSPLGPSQHQSPAHHPRSGCDPSKLSIPPSLRNDSDTATITLVKSALPSASNNILPSAPTDFPHASITKASLTATQAIVSTPFSCYKQHECESVTHIATRAHGHEARTSIGPSALLPSPQSPASASGCMSA